MSTAQHEEASKYYHAALLLWYQRFCWRDANFKSYLCCIPLEVHPMRLVQAEQFRVITSIYFAKHWYFELCSFTSPCSRRSKIRLERSVDYSTKGRQSAFSLPGKIAVGNRLYLYGLSLVYSRQIKYIASTPYIIVRLMRISKCDDYSSVFLKLAIFCSMSLVFCFTNLL